MQDKDSRSRLKSKLKHGDITTISTNSGCSRFAVIRWFKGENDNLNIGEEVLALIHKRRMLKQRVDELAAQ